MARTRTVKPEFWSDRRIGECSSNARLLFLGALNFADDAGGLDRSAKQLKAQVFPYDELDCEPLIDELLKVGLLVEYAVDGNKYLHIKNFLKHQRIDRPGAPRVPLYEDSLSIPRTVVEQSKTIPVSKGREEKGSGREQKNGASQPQPLGLHGNLPTATWNLWLEHRRAKRWPIDARTLGIQLATLAPFDTDTQRRMIETSIQCNWQGIFEPKGNAKPKPQPSTWQPPPDEPDAQH